MLSVVAAIALLPAAPPTDPGYEFVPDTERWVEVLRHNGRALRWSLGKLDAAGNFVPDPRFVNRDGERSGGLCHGIIF